jgi:hypothetical protein
LNTAPDRGKAERKKIYPADKKPRGRQSSEALLILTVPFFAVSKNLSIVTVYKSSVISLKSSHHMYPLSVSRVFFCQALFWLSLYFSKSALGRAVCRGQKDIGIGRVARPHSRRLFISVTGAADTS